MQATIPLEKMTTIEKFRVIEDVWESICHSNEDIPSPKWHADILRSRKKQVCNGELGFLELNEAKRVLRDRLA
jgi:hypothetical protein